MTEFFRDPETFEVLAQAVFPRILGERKTAGLPVRIWVPGCARRRGSLFHSDMPC